MTYWQKAIHFEKELLRRDGHRHDQAWREARARRIMELERERAEWWDEEQKLVDWFRAQEVLKETVQSFPTGEESFRCRKCGHLVDEPGLCAGCKWEDYSEQIEHGR